MIDAAGPPAVRGYAVMIVGPLGLLALGIVLALIAVIGNAVNGDYPFHTISPWLVVPVQALVAVGVLMIAPRMRLPSGQLNQLRFGAYAAVLITAVVNLAAVIGTDVWSRR